MKIIECPRDAMQGIKNFIPTELKIEYINQLLKCGFDTIDFGSFVSPKAIPQMKDTANVLEGIEESKTKLLAIIANERGANDAVQFERIDYLGYPFSVSEEFQKRNTNSTIEESFLKLEKIKSISDKNNKVLVVYLSMGFGNPYGEKWHPDLVTMWSEKLYNRLGIKIIAVSDTIGCAVPESVSNLFQTIIPELPEVEIGAHLHVLREKAKNIIDAAYSSGCRRFDGAIKGYGGCPMAKDDLTGNMPTEMILQYLQEKEIEHTIDHYNFENALSFSSKIFSEYE